MTTNSLTIFTQASVMLAEANTIQKARELRDLSLTAAEWARRKDMGEEAIQHCKSYALEAERRMGEMLTVIQKNVGAKGSIVTSDGQLPVRDPSPTLADLGLTKRDSSEAQQLAEMPEEMFEAVKTGKLPRNKAQSRMRKAKRAKIVEPIEAPIGTGFALDTVQVAKVNEVDLPPASIDMIFTDPPYHENIVHLFGQLAELGAKCLKPGSYLMTYCGKMFLPDIMSLMMNHLEYVWTFCIFQPDNCQKINKHHLFEAWRPILCFKQSGDTDHKEWIPDALRGTRDKTFHEWQQQIEPPTKFIEAYTLPGNIVLDPFVGGGTSLIAARNLKRRYIGFDADEQAVKTTLWRLQNSEQSHIPES